MMDTDMELVRQFAVEHSECAFEMLVSRHLNLVYTTALRQVRNEHQAQEISQAVFIILARKADLLNSRTVLSGWLYRTTQYVSADALKIQRRRHIREQEAHMQSTLNESQAEQVWEQMSPLLDQAMTHLGEKDRDAVVLRFFENKTLREVGDALGLQERAAQKRVNRALEKLRNYFSKRGVVSTTAIIAGIISANSVQAAPTALAGSISAMAISQGAAAGTSTFTLVKGALKIMAWSKAKTAIVTGAAIILTGGATTIVVEKIIQPTVNGEMDESLWSNLSSESLDKAPKTIIIRPTKHPKDDGWVSLNERMLGINQRLSRMLAFAYNASFTRMVLPPDLSQEHFDILMNLPKGNDAAFRNELKNRFGLSAHYEMRDMDVLILKIKTPNAPGLKISNAKYGQSSSGTGKFSMKHQQVGTLAGYLEQFYQKPVIDRTNLTKQYDIELKWENGNKPAQLESIKAAVENQLGLELVPSRESIKMLVVEKSN